MLRQRVLTAVVAVPVLLLPLSVAVAVSVVWGMLILALLSYLIARDQGQSASKTIGEHLLIAIVVIAVTHWVGHMVAQLKP